MGKAKQMSPNKALSITIRLLTIKGSLIMKFFILFTLVFTIICFPIVSYFAKKHGILKLRKTRYISDRGNLL